MAISNRYNFVALFDVELGLPNGDPDSDNAPRQDFNGYGFVTDVCIKNKIRNYVEYVKGGEEGYKRFIMRDAPLNTKLKDAYAALGLKSDKKKEAENISLARKYMCDNYFDVRTFGAVMNTGDNKAGTVRGPIQINNSRSIDPIDVQRVTITRQAITKEGEAKFDNGSNEMGGKYIVPYALYRCEGNIDARLTEKTGFNDEDLELLWNALINLFEYDHSALRGNMRMRKLYVFKHDSSLGNASMGTLMDKITVTKNEDVDGFPASFKDYTIEVDTDMPHGVELIEML